MFDLTLQKDFLEYLKLNKNTSANTLSAYERDLNNFSDFLNVKNLSFLSCSDDDIASFKELLSKSGKSVSTVSRCMSTLRSFFKYLVVTGKISSNPALEIKNDKQEKKYFEILTEDEIDKLLALPNGRDLKGKRDKAMLETLYATGMRVSELISLNVTDVNIRMNYINCRSNKERIIMLYPKAVKILDDYIKSSRLYFVANENEEALFVNINGERMTRQGFWKLLKAYAEKAGISKTITPHTLRHSFATHLLQNGASIHDIKDILGHSDISSTQVYTDFIKKKLDTSYLKFNHRSK